MDWLFGWFDRIVQSVVWKSFFGNFQWVDWIFVVVVVIGLVYGIKAGLFRALVDLLEAIFVAWIAWNFYPLISKVVVRFFSFPQNTVNAIAFFAITLPGFIFIKTLDAHLSKVFHTKLSSALKVLGGAFLGILYVIFIWSILSQPVVLSGWTLMTRAYEKGGSLTGYQVKMLVPRACQYLPAMN